MSNSFQSAKAVRARSRNSASANTRKRRTNASGLHSIWNCWMPVEDIREVSWGRRRESAYHQARGLTLSRKPVPQACLANDTEHLPRRREGLAPEEALLLPRLGAAFGLAQLSLPRSP